VHIRLRWPCRTNSPSKTLADFFCAPKADAATFGSLGGAVPHLAAELFVRAAKIKMTLVPYRGAAPGIQDLIPGRIDSFFNNIAPMLPLSNQGQMRLLAITSAKRSPMAPDLPIMAETLPGYDVTGWYALFVPAKRRGTSSKKCILALRRQPTIQSSGSGWKIRP
jgi:tripartite-type tricarboxylate transporter receptor subunit TctC